MKQIVRNEELKIPRKKVIRRARDTVAPPVDPPAECGLKKAKVLMANFHQENFKKVKKKTRRFDQHGDFKLKGQEILFKREFKQVSLSPQRARR